MSTSETPTSQESLPTYFDVFASYRREFAEELASIIRALPIPPQSVILDMACGTGYFTQLLVEQAQMAKQVIGVDNDPACLTAAQRTTNSDKVTIAYVQADAARLPFDADYFDVSWCGQSFYSLPDPVAALVEMKRVTKPGGLVAVLENDEAHHLLLPWPAELEAAVLQIQRHHQDHTRDPERYYIARRLQAIFAEAGIQEYQKKVFAHTRTAPFSPWLTQYLRTHLESIYEECYHELPEKLQIRWQDFADPASPNCLLYDPDLSITVLDQLAWGRS